MTPAPGALSTQPKVPKVSTGISGTEIFWESCQKIRKLLEISKANYSIGRKSIGTEIPGKKFPKISVHSSQRCLLLRKLFEWKAAQDLNPDHITGRRDF